MIKNVAIICLLYALIHANSSYASSKPWQHIFEIDEVLAKKLIEQQLQFEVTDIEQLGTGWNNVAYLVNKQYVFRFPRRTIGVISIENEMYVLPYIKQHVSFSFSCPAFIGIPSSDYQAPFAGYEVVSGVSLSDTKAELIDDSVWARKLASWFKELHTIPIRAEDYTNIQDDRQGHYDIPLRTGLLLRYLSQYRHHFQISGFDVDELVALVKRFQTHDFSEVTKNVYCHGDVYSRHIIVDPQRQLSGLIDWGSIHIGHPGTDLAVGFTIFSDDALSAFLQEYGDTDFDTYPIALFRAFCMSAVILFYSCEEHEDGMREWSIVSLKKTIERINKTIFRVES